MNRKRRMTLHQVLDYLEKLKEPIALDEAKDLVSESRSKVESCADDEQEALDNRPESLEFSAQNDDMQENIDDLYEASSNLEMLEDMIDEMEVYDYEEIKSDVIEIVNTIKSVIAR